MRDTFAETLTEALVVALEVAAMLVLTGIGLAAERAGLAQLGAGFDVATVWLLFVGSLALYAGVYQLGVRTLLPRVGGLTGQ